MAADSAHEMGSKPWRSALALGLVALFGTALLAAVNQLTQQRIQQQERQAVLRQLGELVPPDRYDNALDQDHYSLRAEAWFPRSQTVTVYRARMRSEPVAVIIGLAATDGYNGNIHLLVGINADGTLCGVRVLSHQETPGLGDVIESGKSDWVLAFSGRSLKDPDRTGWAVKKDGGEFDQFTGATITPRAVVKAVRLALEFYTVNRATIFEQPAEQPDTEKS